MKEASIELQSLIENKIAGKDLGGAVVLGGGLQSDFYHKCFGVADTKTGRAMTMDTVFDMASVTKVVGTATSLALCAATSRLDFDRPFTDYLPEYRVKLNAPITIRQLATHLSGFDNAKPYHRFINDGKLMLDAVLDTAPVNPPMQNYTYACVNFILLGMVVEKITGLALGDFAAEHIFRPLGMNDTCWGKSKRMEDTVRVQATKDVEPGIISDETARSAYPRNIGNAGLFSTAADLAKFCRMMLRRGEPILPPEITGEFFKNLSPEGILPHAFGWRLFPLRGMSSATIWHTGWSGQAVIIDPAKKAFVVLLSNRRCKREEFQKLKEDVAAILIGMV